MYWCCSRIPFRTPWSTDCYLNLAIFKFTADTRKMISSDSCLCETSFDAVDAVKLEIPEGFKFFDQKTIQYPENKITIDNLVKSRFWDGKEKSSRSRRANSEECSVLSCT